MNLDLLENVVNPALIKIMENDQEENLIFHYVFDGPVCIVELGTVTVPVSYILYNVLIMQKKIRIHWTRTVTLKIFKYWNWKLISMNTSLIRLLQLLKMFRNKHDVWINTHVQNILVRYQVVLIVICGYILKYIFTYLQILYLGIDSRIQRY